MNDLCSICSILGFHDYKNLWMLSIFWWSYLRFPQKTMRQQRLLPSALLSFLCFSLSSSTTTDDWKSPQTFLCLSSLHHPLHQIPNQRHNNHFQKQPRLCCVNLQTILKEKDLSRKQSGALMEIFLQIIHWVHVYVCKEFAQLSVEFNSSTLLHQLDRNFLALVVQIHHVGTECIDAPCQENDIVTSFRA